jgi:cholera toxin transcriptional activator
LPDAQPDRRVFRFGVFELDAFTGELRRDGKAQPRLRDQSLRILRLLLERPRGLVTRDELRQLLWSSDTFVDFDHGLNSAVNQLRSALNDPAANPRFVQTIPRRGYRFIAPVDITPSLAEIASAPSPSDALASDPQPPSLPQSAPQSPASDPPSRSSFLSDAHELPSASRATVRVLFALIQVMYLCFYVASLARLSRVEALLAPQPHARLILIGLIVTAAAAIPIRLYLLSAAAFNYRGLAQKFQKLFPLVLPLDALWALAPFLLIPQIGIGLAIGATAALLYLPFAQRSLLLMPSSSNR